jgi:hypothetical protein
MALRCDRGDSGCSVLTIFMRTKEEKWRSDRRLPCAKTEGEMGEQGPGCDALRKEGEGVDRLMELWRRGILVAGNGQAWWRRAAAGRRKGSRWGSGWNGVAWACRGRVAAGSLPRTRPGEQCHFQIIRKFSN